ncbi:MAG: FAD-binding protein [Thermoplasmata archaeon]|nr:FAD-binding protein [Thermoplasmata archaeon]
MELAVVVKVVPEGDHVGFDAARGTLRRDDGSLVLNPFDQRALRVAIELRRPGERVTVVSMGPPSVEPALRETLALGADHAILVSDTALAGSDTLVTARVLARILEPLAPGLVVTGKRTTDSETGQVPAQLAALLGHSLVGPAKRLTRSDSGTSFDVTVETETGWARLAANAPIVVSVGEKIGKPLKLGERPASTSGVLERRDLASLGFTPEEVGLAGSPTVVDRLVDRASPRRGVVFTEGSPSARASAAVAALREILTERARSPAPVSVPPVAAARHGDVWVLVTDDAGTMDAGSLGAITECRRSLPARRCVAVGIGPAPSPLDSRRLAAAGADVLLQLPVTERWTARTAAMALAQRLGEDRGVGAVVFPATAFGRELGGRLSAALGLGLTGDAVELGQRPDGTVVFGKPSFGGGIIAEIRTRTRPALATLRFHTFAAGSSEDGARLPTEAGPTVAADGSVRLEGRGQDPRDALLDPDGARIVISVGVGGSGPDLLAELRRLAVAWSAGLVGTRRVVDAGVLPLSRQVGLTGRSIAPDLGILVGVRGSPNHMVAWRRARALLAINPDATAPVFAACDVGILGRAEEILPLLADDIPRLLPP